MSRVRTETYEILIHDEEIVDLRSGLLGIHPYPRMLILSKALYWIQTNLVRIRSRRICTFLLPSFNNSL